MSNHLEPITITVARARELTGLSTSSIYRLFKSGKLKRQKLGGKTLIHMSELRAMLNALPDST